MDGDASTKFIGSLTKFLQSLCNGYVEFQRGVELVGHIYLSIDTGEKVDYILHEKVSKNDENSVTFVSNSFHAQPSGDQDKNKAKTNRDAASKSSIRGSNETPDDDDIMIVDQSRGVPGSTNSGSIPARGLKRGASPTSAERHSHRRHSAGHGELPSGVANQQHPRRPSATVTSFDTSHQENLNVVDLKLEQISRDELLSLASQVGDGGPPHSSFTEAVSQHTGIVPASSRDSRVRVKEEPVDDAGGGNEAGQQMCKFAQYT